MKKFFIAAWEWIRSWLQRKPVRFKTEHVEELPDQLEPATIYIAGDGVHLWFVAMICPCGCGETLHMNLQADTRPRWSLTRSFDQRSHSYLGYALRIQGIIGNHEREFLVGIGEGAQAKHQFRAGDFVSGRAEPVADPKMEPVEFYKVSGVKIIERAGEQDSSPPPWLGVPLGLPIYRERGHRRLDAKTYQARCLSCIWGCRMPVEMIIDQWNPSQKKYRFETFCYGPKSCSLYRPGPTRKVPGRKGMSWEEEGWIDEEATAHRDDDE